MLMQTIRIRNFFLSVCPRPRRCTGSADSPLLKLEAQRKLDGTGSTRAKHLDDTARWLPECRRLSEVRPVAGQIGDVEEIEHLDERQHGVLFLKPERPGDSDILRDQAVTECVTGR